MKQKNEWIEKLLDITYSINKIYGTLAQYELEGNETKYQEWFECLKMCIEVEEKTYKDYCTNQTFELEIDRILRKIEYLNHRRIADEDEKALIINRIISYLETKNYLNPFLSLQEDFILREEENELAIANQYNFDYVYNLISLLNQKRNNTNIIQIKKAIIDAKYQIIFVNKIIEFSLLNNPIILPEIFGKERAILFNQEKELVNNVYLNSCLYQFNSALSELLALEEISDESIEKESIKQVELTNIECTILFFDEKNIQEILSQLSDLSKQEKYTKVMKEVYSIIKNNQSNHNKSKKLTIS